MLIQHEFLELSNVELWTLWAALVNPQVHYFTSERFAHVSEMDAHKMLMRRIYLEMQKRIVAQGGSL